MTGPSIVMVHGAFCGGWTFDQFRQPFERAGLRVSAPDLPGHAASAPRGAVAGLSMNDYADSLADLIAAEPEPPILIGHSLGGLVAQMAAQHRPIAALILLAPSPPWGVLGGSLEEAASAASLYALGPFWLQAIDPDFGVAGQYTLDGLAKPDRAAVFARMAPESGRAMWETLNWWLDPFMTTRVDPNRIGAPTLVIAGQKDLIHPPATVGQTARRLGASMKVMPDMSHWLVSEPGWEAVAETCLTWLDTVADLKPEPSAAKHG